MKKDRRRRRSVYCRRSKTPGRKISTKDEDAILYLGAHKTRQGAKAKKAASKPWPETAGNTGAVFPSLLTPCLCLSPPHLPHPMMLAASRKD